MEVLSIVQAMQVDIAFLNQKEQGRWKIENNQLTYYDVGGTIPLKRFNLFDKDGNPTNDSPYERVPV